MKTKFSLDYQAIKTKDVCPFEVLVETANFKKAIREKLASTESLRKMRGRGIDIKGMMRKRWDMRRLKLQ